MSQINAKEGKEIGKLIEYAYNLHEGEYIEICDFEKPFYFCDRALLRGKEFEGGGMLVRLAYPGHGTDELCTQILVYKNDKEDPKKITFAHLWETSNAEYEFWHTNLIEFELNFSYEENMEAFVEAMQMIGFKKEDVIKVIKGEMKARRAYKNIAPKSKKHYWWIETGKRFYTFDRNVAIEGDFSQVMLDYFPFPFKKHPILDCSKVKTNGVWFGENIHKVELINIGENSIKDTNLENAIIKETIDLSKINAEGTKFGNQVLINVDKSLAPIETMDLSLATDVDGNHFDYEYIETLQKEQKRIKVYANADNRKMAKVSFQNKPDGIGLIRTEDALDKRDKNQINLIAEYLFLNKQNGADQLLKTLFYNQLKEILDEYNEGEITVRLFCPDIDELLNISDIDYKGYYDSNILLSTGILQLQLEVIAAITKAYDINLNILIPTINNDSTDVIINRIKEATKESRNIKIGTMIEDRYQDNIEQLAKISDFIVIGTNDLTENIMHKKRDYSLPEFTILNENTKNCIELIVEKIRSFNKNIRIGICGEHSNYPENLEFYQTLAINYITCSPYFIKQNKEILKGKTSKVRKLKSYRH